MQPKPQPRGYSSSGYIAIVDGRRMEFATYEEYRDYIRDDLPQEVEAAWWIAFRQHSHALMDLYISFPVAPTDHSRSSRLAVRAASHLKIRHGPDWDAS